MGGGGWREGNCRQLLERRGRGCELWLQQLLRRGGGATGAARPAPPPPVVIGMFKALTGNICAKVLRLFFTHT